ncbi:site-specific integrase [Amycolatopsis sp. NPDC004079]|uniref:tyrosine-type recombinase/integrase n=1 Tax=Amycolatopsis sp. NPDC004079 TaxID=3154549 RepID=UPI0033B6A02F
MTTATATKKKTASATPRLAKAEKLPSGRWRAYVWDCHRKAKVWATNPDDGTEVFQEQWVAEAAQVALYHRMEEVYDELGDPQDRKGFLHPFPEVAREWLVHREKQPGKRGSKERGGTYQSRNARKSAVNVLSRAFAKYDIRQVNQEKFLEYLDQEEERGMSSSTIEGRVVYMRQIQRFAQVKGYIEDDCTDGIAVSVERRREPRILTDQELCLLSNYVPFWFYAAVLLAYDCGLRAAEVAGLRWMRIDLDAKIPQVTVRDVMEPDKTLRSYPKGKITQTVSLTPRCVEAFRVLQQWRPDDGPDDFVFRNLNGTLLSPIDPGEIMREVWDLVGLAGERAKFHDLRHACATNLAEADAPLEVIMRRMRHKSPAVTMKYIRKSLEREAEWAARVQDAANAEIIDLYNERARRRPAAEAAAPTALADGSVVVSAAQWNAMVAMLQTVTGTEGAPPVFAAAS